MVEDYSSIGGFLSQMRTKPCKAIGPPQKKSDNLGLYIHRTGNTDERNSTCGALFPAIVKSFAIELARSVSFFLSFVRYFFLSFFSPSLLSLSRFLSLAPLSHSFVFVANFLLTMSYVRGIT